MSVISRSKGFNLPPQHQPDGVLNQANPVSGDKYPILDTTKNVIIYDIIAVVTWTVQPTPLEVHITLDGNTILHTQGNPVTATTYYCWRNPSVSEILQGFATSRQEMAFLYQGRNIKIEAETTGGTVSNLSGRVKYGRWP